MRNIVLTIAYDGTAYHGWQCQPTAMTVQEILTSTVARIVDHEVKIYSAARTDAGVHALGQVVNFRTDKPIALEKLMRGLNSLLPLDIRILGGRETDPDFHSRYSARSKSYIYIILNGPTGSPFMARYAWHIPYNLEVPGMHRCMRNLLGKHDFSSFKKKLEIYHDHERSILRAGVKRRGRFIYIVVEGTGFLRYMVRNIVGTLVLVGSGKLTEKEFTEILQSRDRENAGPTAPAHGLFLRNVWY